MQVASQLASDQASATVAARNNLAELNKSYAAMLGQVATLQAQPDLASQNAANNLSAKANLMYDYIRGMESAGSIYRGSNGETYFNQGIHTPNRADPVYQKIRTDVYNRDLYQRGELPADNPNYETVASWYSPKDVYKKMYGFDTDAVLSNKKADDADVVKANQIMARQKTWEQNPRRSGLTPEELAAYKNFNINPNQPTLPMDQLLGLANKMQGQQVPPSSPNGGIPINVPPPDLGQITAQMPTQGGMAAIGMVKPRVYVNRFNPWAYPHIFGAGVINRAGLSPVQPPLPFTPPTIP